MHLLTEVMMGQGTSRHQAQPTGRVSTQADSPSRKPQIIKLLAESIPRHIMVGPQDHRVQAGMMQAPAECSARLRHYDSAEGVPGKVRKA